VNLRFGYAPSAGNWELAVWDQLTNEYYLNRFFHSLWDIDFATVGRPREAGVELKFGSLEGTMNERVISTTDGYQRCRPMLSSGWPAVWVVAASVACLLQGCSVDRNAD